MTETTTKPKKVLTEAQRLAFMKGREKRLQNIMLKKAAKEEENKMEEEGVTTTEEPPSQEEEKQSPLKIKIKRVKKEPEPEPPSHPDQPGLDVDAIADKLFEKMK
jgi:hypothetical protein